MNTRILISNESFYAIKAGYKTIELFEDGEIFNKVIEGKEVILYPEENSYVTEAKTVAAIISFKDIKSAFVSLPLLKCGYTPFTLRYATPDDFRGICKLKAGLPGGITAVKFKEEPLQRFLAGQSSALPDCSGYDTALQEIKSGRKETHFIWSIFPQIKGLTPDPVTEYFGLDGYDEASAYFSHPILGERLQEITKALLKLNTNDPVSVFGMVDAFKLRASMTLFEAVTGNEIFTKALEKFCLDKRDNPTLSLLRK